MDPRDHAPPDAATNVVVDVAQSGREWQEAGNLDELLQEVRILQQGAQVLTAFLVIIPFNTGFAKINRVERWIYIATFISSVVSLILLSAPAVQHRAQWPLRNRVAFKSAATRIMLAGAVVLAVALVLATLLVTSEVLGWIPGGIATGLIALVLGATWWVIPVRQRQGATGSRRV